MIHLDTHVALWLWVADLSRIPSPLAERMGIEDLAVSPMVRLELSYLHQIGRVTDTAERVVSGLARQIGLREDQASFAAVIAEAESMTWTRDPFDRIVAAHAIAAGAVLATSDRVIREALPEHTVWD